MVSEKGDDRLLRPLRHEGHRRPVTRREFLAQGLVSGLSIVAMPSLVQLLARAEVAGAQSLADCPIGVGGAGRIPFIGLDLGGGANVAGSNVLVGGPGGQLDFLPPEGYLKLGLPADSTPQQPGQIDTLPFVVDPLDPMPRLAFHIDSAFFRGLVSKTSEATRMNTNGSIFCARSENDTGNNPHNPMFGINKAGADGDLVALIGTESSDSGGRSMSPLSMYDPAVRPTKIDRPSDATGLVDTGKLVQLLSQDDAASVMQAMDQISRFKITKMQADAAIRDKMACSYAQGADLVARYGDPDVLNPLADPLITGQVDSILTDDEVNGNFRRVASVMKLVVNGFAGAGTIEFGGYDYHDSTRATGEVRDFFAGQVMGTMLEYAARRGQQLMLYVFSDGSVACDGTLDDSVEGRGKGIWRNDNSTTASTFVLVYDPAGPPRLTTAGPQIGWFRSSGDLETGATRVSNNVNQLAEAIVLNYLALHDEVGRLDSVLPAHGLGSGSELDSLVAFQPIRSPMP